MNLKQERAKNNNSTQVGSAGGYCLALRGRGRYHWRTDASVMRSANCVLARTLVIVVRMERGKLEHGLVVQVQRRRLAFSTGRRRVPYHDNARRRSVFRRSAFLLEQAATPVPPATPLMTQSSPTARRRQTPTHGHVECQALQIGRSAGPARIRMRPSLSGRWPQMTSTSWDWPFPDTPATPKISAALTVRLTP